MVRSTGTATRAAEWDDVASRDSASWYLDPLVAEQKRQLNADLVRNTVHRAVGVALKTDAFEEAFGGDSPLPELLHLADTWIAMDATGGIVRRAAARNTAKSVCFVAADIRSLPLRTAGLDLVFSNSTLDHFETAAEFDAAILEMARVLRPGGRLVFTTDNPLNPGYWVLRALCHTRFAPFPLGYTPTPGRLHRLLKDTGFTIHETGYLIHNPRGLSTVLFLLLRRIFRERADGPVRAALALFEWMGRWPTRPLTACYLTVHATRRP